MRTSINFVNGLGTFATEITVIYFLVTVSVHITFAAAVFVDARNQLRQWQRRTFLVGPVVWGMATLVGGVFVATAYWFIHHSALRPPPQPLPPPTSAPAP